MTTTTPNNSLYVLNPNYSPLDPNSKRYVTDAQAQTEAANRATSLNNLFAPFTQLASGLIPKYDASNFYSPLSPTATVNNGTQVPSATYSGAPAAKPATPTGSSNMAAPTQAVNGVVTVQAGDTLSAIAARNGTTVAALAAANGIADPNRIAIGQQIKIASGSAPLGGAHVAQNASAPVGGANAGAAPAPSASSLTTDELSQLASLAGKAGVSTDAFLQLIQQNATPTNATTEAIRTKLGIPNLVDQTYATPSKTLVQQYTDLYNLSGLNDIKAKIAAVDATITQKTDALNQATGELNSNPWISQATRAGRLKNLQQLAYADINNQLTARQQYMDLYNSGVSQLETQLNLANTDQQNAQKLNVDHLNYLLNEAERQTTAAKQDSITAGLRTVPDYLKGLQENTAAKNAQELAKIYAQKAVTTAGNPTLNGKPQTAVQAQVQTYADRMTQADAQLSQIENDFTGASSVIGSFLPNALQSSERQQFEQSKRNFVNAILRRESGAAISQSEFDNAERQYFAQPGDSAETLAQKKANRQTVINGFYREANIAAPSLSASDVTQADLDYIASLGLK